MIGTDPLFYKFTKLIFYKLNSLLIKKCLLTLLHQGIYGFRTNTIIYPKSIFFDLNHSSTHLGDRLFLVRFAKACNENNIKILLAPNDLLTIQIFDSLELSFKICSYYKYDMRLSLMPSINFEKKFIDKDIILSFTEFHNLNLTEHLVKNLLGIEYVINEKWPHKKKFHAQSDNSIILYSPYVNSGFFRMIKKKKKFLQNTISKISYDKKEIWLMGSETDKSANVSDSEDYLIDKRGKLSITDIIEMFKANQVNMVIAFDNFYMHLAQLFCIPSLIKFRGRLLKKNTNLHLKTINKACASKKNFINYL